MKFIQFILKLLRYFNINQYRAKGINAIKTKSDPISKDQLITTYISLMLSGQKEKASEYILWNPRKRSMTLQYFTEMESIHKLNKVTIFENVTVNSIDEINEMKSIARANLSFNTENGSKFIELNELDLELLNDVWIITSIKRIL